MDVTFSDVIKKLTNGVLPEDLEPKYIAVLKKELGEDWFYRLGYSEKKYTKPIY